MKKFIHWRGCLVFLVITSGVGYLVGRGLGIGFWVGFGMVFIGMLINGLIIMFEDK